MKSVVNQQGVRKRLGGSIGRGVIIEQVDQRLDIIAAQHGAEDFGGAHRIDQINAGIALGHIGQKRSLDIGGLVNTRGNAVHQQLH